MKKEKQPFPYCNKTHGQHGTRLYIIWKGMKLRCFTKTSTGYKTYGLKGITVCKSWMEFKNFMKWSLDNGYSDLLQIDRINGKGNYKPSNCRWVTAKENIQNNWKHGCKKGHPWKVDNTGFQSNGRRYCKLCRTVSLKKYYEKKRASR